MTRSFGSMTPPGSRTKVCVSEVGIRLGGFVCVEYREWNRLGQVQGLAVKPALKRQGIASEFVHRVEEFVRAEGGRGLYADTPATNEVWRRCYEALGCRRAYVVPEYYDEGLEGVAHPKLFAT
jgi:ribosomal protein S18 acetylase RimI-like enzyme